tara:strand:+ start:15917 stop:16126 length:210 start_codon:yes stop_codon:yes gene_type:complete
MPSKKESVDYFLKNGVNHPEAMKEEQKKMDKMFKTRHLSSGEDNHIYHSESYVEYTEPEPAPAPAPSGF